MIIAVAIGVVIIVAVVLLAIHLSPRETAAATPAPSATSSPIPPTPAPSATTPPGLAPGDHSITVEVQGRARTLILHVPPAALDSSSLPLVLVYHGATDTAAGTQSSTDFDTVADQRGMLLAFLQGYQDTWNEGAGHTPAERAGINDVEFTSAALVAIAKQHPYDAQRVAAVGLSNGALLTDLLGCRLAASIHLIVPVAGPLPVSVSPSCVPSRAVSVYEIHGTADTTIPYNGGSFVGVGGGTTVLSAPAAVARWAAIDGCARTPAKTTPSADLRLTSYSGCRDGQKVQLLTGIGDGHGWPPNVGVFTADALGVTGS